MTTKDNRGASFWFDCPGCGETHRVPVRPSAHNKVVWDWDGNVARPTISPSLLVDIRGSNPAKCHSYIKGGQIQFLNDCTHALKGQTVDIPNLELRFESGD